MNNFKYLLLIVTVIISLSCFSQEKLSFPCYKKMASYNLIVDIKNNEVSLTSKGLILRKIKYESILKPGNTLNYAFVSKPVKTNDVKPEDVINRKYGDAWIIMPNCILGLIDDELFELETKDEETFKDEYIKLVRVFNLATQNSSNASRNSGSSSSSSSSSTSTKSTLSKKMSGEAKSIRLEYNVYKKGEYGMNVVCSFNVKNMKGKKSFITAYFYNGDGSRLINKSIDYNYTTDTKQIARNFDICPRYDNSNYNDVKIFVPYRVFPK